MTPPRDVGSTGEVLQSHGGQPVEYLYEQQAGEQGQYAHVKLLSENSQRQASLGDGVLGLTHQLLHLIAGQHSEVQPLQQSTSEEEKEEGEIAQYDDIQLVGGEEQHTRVELRATAVRVHERQHSHTRRNTSVAHKRQHGWWAVRTGQEWKRAEQGRTDRQPDRQAASSTDPLTLRHRAHQVGGGSDSD